MKRLLPVLAAALLASCASQQHSPDREQVAQANMQADVISLKSVTQELRKRTEDLESVLGRKGRGFTLEDVNRRLDQLEQTVNRMAARLGIEQTAAAPSPSGGWAGEAAPPSGPYGVSPAHSEPSRAGTYAPYAAETPPAGPITMGPDSTDPAEAIYNMGMEAYNRREYDRANTLFSELLKSYPSSRQAPGALYWQAEANYQQGDYGRAALLCQDLIQKHPNHPLASSAMIKQAQSFRKLGKAKAARILLEDVARRYPGSPEAVSAQALLRELR